MLPSERCVQIHKCLLRKSLHEFLGPGLPRNGLYFFYEEGEICPHTDEGRIVRVGNHPRSQNGLIRRLRMHYGGNKNSSVFRKFLGGALLRRQDPNHLCLQPAPGQGHWEKQDAKPCTNCKPIEKEVSRLLRERFRFRCVEIIDQEERNYLEERIVATLARCPECQPSPNWLGRYAYNKNVVKAGLWNSDYVDSLPLTPDNLKRFEQLVGK